MKKIYPFIIEKDNEKLIKRKQNLYNQLNHNYSNAVLKINNSIPAMDLNVEKQKIRKNIWKRDEIVDLYSTYVLFKKFKLKLSSFLKFFKGRKMTQLINKIRIMKKKLDGFLAFFLDNSDEYFLIEEKSIKNEQFKYFRQIILEYLTAYTNFQDKFINEDNYGKKKKDKQNLDNFILSIETNNNLNNKLLYLSDESFKKKKIFPFKTNPQRSMNFELRNNLTHRMLKNKLELSKNNITDSIIQEKNPNIPSNRGYKFGYNFNISKDDFIETLKLDLTNKSGQLNLTKYQDNSIDFKNEDQKNIDFLNATDEKFAGFLEKSNDIKVSVVDFSLLENISNIIHNQSEITYLQYNEKLQKNKKNENDVIIDEVVLSRFLLEKIKSYGD